jgi:hypothetical protein
MASPEDQDARRNLETIRAFLGAREFDSAAYRAALEASKELHRYAGQRQQGSGVMNAINREGLEGLDCKIEKARKQQQSGALHQPEPDQEEEE